MTYSLGQIFWAAPCLSHSPQTPPVSPGLGRDFLFIFFSPSLFSLSVEYFLFVLFSFHLLMSLCFSLLALLSFCPYVLFHYFLPIPPPFSFHSVLPLFLLLYFLSSLFSFFTFWPHAHLFLFHPLTVISSPCSCLSFILSLSLFLLSLSLMPCSSLDFL